jgi:DNA invertase Pin-like site-specific DNA recombinase
MAGMDRHPASYIRRSHVDPDSPGDISEAAQLAAVRKLAAKDGHNGDLTVYSDWGKSADILKRAKRTAYTQLLADMDAGRISAVYAFDVDRLYRDPRDLIHLQDAAQRHAVTITTTAGALAIGEGDDPAAEGFAFMGAVFARMELQKAKKRTRAAMAERRARGDALGRPPYGFRFGRDGERVILEPNPDEPVGAVLAAVRDAGSYSGAARLLNAVGLRPRSAATWSGNTVRRIVRHATPKAAQERRRPGRRSRHDWTLAGLLRCPCGGLMTARETFTKTKYGRFGPYVGYQCPRARYTADHPRPYMVSEAVVLPWIRAEADKYVLPDEVEKAGPDADALRAELEAERAHVTRLALVPGVDLETVKTRLASIDERIAAIVDEAVVEELGPIDWDDTPPAELNAVLRAYWKHIQLDEAMRPVKAEWRIARMRS